MEEKIEKICKLLEFAKINMSNYQNEACKVKDFNEYKIFENDLRKYLIELKNNYFKIIENL